jgi:hypothetical protein
VAERSVTILKRSVSSTLSIQIACAPKRASCGVDDEQPGSLPARRASSR